MLLSTAIARRVERDRAVALVDLADEDVARADQRAGEGRVGRDEILHHRAVHHRRVAAGARAGSSRSCRWWSICRWCRRRRCRSRRGVEQLGEQLGARHQRARRRAARPGTSGTVSSTAAEATTIWSARVMPLPSCGKSAMPCARRKSNLCAVPALVERAVGAGDRVALRRARSAPAAACRCRRCRRRNRPWPRSSPRRYRHAPCRHKRTRVAEESGTMRIAEDGVRIGVVAPGSRLEPAVAERGPALAQRALSDAALEIALPPAMLSVPGHFAGDDARARRRLRRGRQRSRASTRSGSRAAATAPAASPSSCCRA